MEHHLSAGVVTYVYDELAHQPFYLIIKHTDGHWDLPKGHVDAGETHEQTAERELYEETGLKAIFDPYFRHTSEYDFTTRTNTPAHKTVYWFVGKATSRAVILSHEHTEFAWLPYERAIEKITYDRTKMVLQEAHGYITRVR